MENTRRVLWVNTSFTDDSIEEFRRVQHDLGIKTNADVVRHLVRQYAQEIQEPNQPCPVVD